MSFRCLAPILTNFVKYNNPQLLSKPRLNFLKTSTYFNSHLVQLKEVEQIDTQVEKNVTESVLKQVNLDQKVNPSRTFAVVQICGKQFKVTSGDVVIVEGYWPPDVGDKLNLNKVLLAGGINFSLIGSPLVKSGLVNVHATVIEKTLSHTKTHFRKKRRKQYMRINFNRCERTVLRINDIGVGQLKETVD